MSISTASSLFSTLCRMTKPKVVPWRLCSIHSAKSTNRMSWDLCFVKNGQKQINLLIYGAETSFREKNWKELNDKRSVNGEFFFSVCEEINRKVMATNGSRYENCFPPELVFGRVNKFHGNFSIAPDGALITLWGKWNVCTNGCNHIDMATLLRNRSG